MPRSVLIVDDNEILRVVLRHFFDSLVGWEWVGDAADGSEAIQKAAELKPDLILLDFAMPGMNGVETASILKQSSPNSHVILYTVYGEALRSRSGSSSGIDLVVSKAEGYNGLVRAIHDLAL